MELNLGDGDVVVDWTKVKGVLEDLQAQLQSREKGDFLREAVFKEDVVRKILRAMQQYMGSEGPSDRDRNPDLVRVFLGVMADCCNRSYRPQSSEDGFCHGNAQILCESLKPVLLHTLFTIQHVYSDVESVIVAVVNFCARLTRCLFVGDGAPCVKPCVALTPFVILAMRALPSNEDIALDGLRFFNVLVNDNVDARRVLLTKSELVPAVLKVVERHSEHKTVVTSAVKFLYRLSCMPYAVSVLKRDCAPAVLLPLLSRHLSDVPLYDHVFRARLVAAQDAAATCFSSTSRKRQRSRCR